MGVSALVLSVPASAGYREDVLDDEPVAYWRLGESSGTTAVDSSGSGFAGTYANVSLGEPGALDTDDDTSASFNGSSASVTVGDQSELDFGGNAAFSVELWVKPRTVNNPADNAIRLVEHTDGVGGYSGWQLVLRSDTGVRLQRWASGGGDTAAAPPLPLNRWSHVVGTYDGSTLRVYVNGVLAASQASTRSVPTVASSLYLGVARTGGLALDGWLDDVALYPAALSAARVQARYQAARASGYYSSQVVSDGPVYYWRLGEAGGTVADDAMNNLDLAYAGSPTFGVTGVANGDPNTAVELDGATESASAGAASTVSFVNTLTIEAWVWPGVSTSSANRDTIYSHGEASGQPQLELGGNGGTNRVAVIVPGVFVAVTGDGAVTPGQWNHVVYTRSGAGATHKIYVNAVEKPLGTSTTTSFTDAPSTKGVGARSFSAGTQRFEGKLDEVAVYAKALSAQRVLAHYQAAIATEAPALVSEPVITGIHRVGETLSVSDGSWSPVPASHAYQWLRCDSAGKACTEIAGANGKTRVLASADAGWTLRARVTAANGFGSTESTATETRRIADTWAATTPPSLPPIGGGLSSMQALGSSATLAGTTAESGTASSAEEDWICDRRWAQREAGTIWALPGSGRVVELWRRNAGGTCGGWYTEFWDCVAVPTYPWNTCGNDSQTYDGIGGQLSFRLAAWDYLQRAVTVGSLKSRPCTRSNVQVRCYVMVRPATGPPPEQLAGSECGGRRHANNPTECQSDPVNSATGAFVTGTVDLRLPALGLPFAFERSYSSQNRTAGSLGPGWTHNFAVSLAVEPSDVVLRGERGEQLRFKQNGDGTFRVVAGGRSTLSAVSGGYELARPDQVRYTFDAAGRLLSIRDRNGHGFTLSYSAGLLAAISDAANRTITLSYNPSGLLSSMGLPDGRAVAYGYTDGRLTSVTDASGGVTTYAYDANGRLSRVVDPNNDVVVENIYVADGRVSSQLDGLGRQTSFAWDPETETSTATDARGNAWKDVYRDNLLYQRVDGAGNATTYGFDPNYNLTSLTDAKGKTTIQTYDAAGNLTRVVAPAPLGYEATFTYDAFNDPLTATDGRGNTTAYAYDAAGNLIQITEPGSTITTLTRDAQTKLVSAVTDARGKTSQLEHDAHGQVTAVVSPLGGRTTFSYDSGGRLASSVEPRGNAAGANPDDYRTSFSYDAADRLLSATDPLGHQTRFAYDASGRLTSRTDALDRVTSYAYDDAGRLTSVTAPDNTVSAYAYDQVGNLTGRTDANNHLTTFAYDAANRLSSVLTPLNARWTYNYDANGNLTKVVDANGNATPDPADGATAYTYDALGRLTGIDYSDATPDVQFAYDANGNRTSMTDGAGTVSYIHDPLDRLTEVARGSDVFSYLYDGVGNVTQRSYPGGQAATYGYDDDGRLASVASAGQTTTYGYDVAGQLTSVTLPAANGYLETRAYDRAGRVSEVRHAKAGVTLALAQYAYDAAGNPSAVTREDGVEAYAYDALDRLTEVCFAASCPGASDPFIRWAYDAVGNRTSETRPAGTTTYVYDSDDRLTSSNGPAGTTTYAFDENGSQTQAGSWTFGYDLSNRLVSTTAAGSTTGYGYDGDGVRRTVTSGASAMSLLWDVNFALPQPAVERDAGGTTLRRYLYGFGPISFDAGGGSSYLHSDALGSVVATTSASGASEWRYAYEPFGLARAAVEVEQGAPASPLRFAGEQLDPTFLYHLRARQYDPSVGRFTTADPIPQTQFGPSVSTYVYANARPTFYVDPSGLFGWVPAAIGGVIGAGAGIVQAVAQGEDPRGILLSGLMGAAEGAAVGMVPLSGLLARASASAGIAAVSNGFAQWLGHRSRGRAKQVNWNYTALGGALVSGFFGGLKGEAVADALVKYHRPLARATFGSVAALLPGALLSPTSSLVGEQTGW